MIGVSFNTGGRYNPTTNNWTVTSVTNAPVGRSYHSAVWTGSEMIVWGGFIGGGDTNTGGKYNPGTNSWIATSTTNAPIARAAHVAVWTGGEMIVWGGSGNAGTCLTVAGDTIRPPIRGRPQAAARLVDIFTRQSGLAAK